MNYLYAPKHKAIKTKLGLIKEDNEDEVVNVRVSGLTVRRDSTMGNSPNVSGLNFLNTSEVNSPRLKNIADSPSRNTLVKHSQSIVEKPSEINFSSIMRKIESTKEQSLVKSTPEIGNIMDLEEKKKKKNNEPIYVQTYVSDIDNFLGVQNL
jgi:hypothetical protein